MSEFSLESFAEKIHYGKTKSYFQEVLSSYQNRNYRSAVVMLWSVAVCDIIYKLQNLVDLYDDKVAKAILKELTALQDSDPKSSVWEINLIDHTYQKTNLLDSSEYENLRYLQKQRHLSAHPILNSNRELHEPNKETVRALIRNTLEGLLIKPPFYTKKITDELLADIAEAAPTLNTKEKVKTYVESRYLSRLKLDVELSIYKTLWKLVFRIDNPDCIKNRTINFWVLELITNRQHNNILEKIKGDIDYYSNISLCLGTLTCLVFYLSKNRDFYEVLDESAKLKIQHHIENTDFGRVYGWFLKDSLEDYYRDIIPLIEGSSHLSFNDNQLKNLLEISDTAEWQSLSCNLLSIYYCASKSFNEADLRFQQAISPYLDLFDEEALFFLIKQIERNDQVYRRGGAIEAHEKVKQKLIQLHDEELDLTPYPHFKANVDLFRKSKK